MGPYKKLIIPALAAAAALAVLLKLGFWQLDRLAWKEHLIAQVEEGVSKDPVPAPRPKDWPAIGEETDYRHVEVTGRFAEGAVFYYIALSNPQGPVGGPGYMVYAPFTTADGWTVLVNRGFITMAIPPDLKAEAITAPQGEMQLTGLLRLSEKPNWTTAAPADGVWFARDTAAMGEFLGVSETRLAPYSIDLDAAFTPPSGLPEAGETIVRFKNDHLGYALTWFGLAATLVGVFLTYAAGVLWPRDRRQV
ncbi:SURF1 family protein [Rhodobacterales bacterium]|nr:SURF1 family protein [Rhodobacterales bacterium]